MLILSLVSFATKWRENQFVRFLVQQMKILVQQKFIFLF